MKAGILKFTYNIELITTDIVTGEVKDRSEIKNLIVNTGLERMAKLMNGISSTYFNCIAIGTDDTPVNGADTELGAEVDREVATLTYEGSYQAKFAKVFTFGSGIEYTIKEVGIFDNITASGSIMFNRALDTGKIVDADTSLTINVTITCA